MMPVPERPTYSEKVRAWRLIEVAISGNLVSIGQRMDWCRRVWWTHGLLKPFIWSTLTERMDEDDFKRLHDFWTAFRTEKEQEIWI